MSHTHTHTSKFPFLNPRCSRIKIQFQILFKLALQRFIWTDDLDPSNCQISGSGGNFDNFIDEPFMGRLPCYNFLTIDILPNKITKISPTTINQTGGRTLLIT